MNSTLDRKPLGQLLLTRGTVKPEHIERALEEQCLSNHQKLLGEVLVELKLCSEDQITEALAEAYDVPYAQVSPKLVDPRIVALLPREFLEKHSVIPLFLVDGMLTVAVAEPANVFLIEEVARVSGYPVQVVAATACDIRATLRALLSSGNDFDVHGRDGTKLTGFAAGESGTAKLIEACISSAVKEGASDIHIEPGENVLRVRHRIDGRLVEKLRPPFAMHVAVSQHIKTLAGLDVSEFRRPQDGAIRITIDKRPIDLRVDIVPGKYAEKIVLHLIDHDKASMNLEKLGFGYDTLKQWRKLLAQPSGILLVTGPAGSGKTSTLYASLQEINSADANICTIEDPVEYALPGMNQFQVNEAGGFTFAAAMRSILRQDPNAVMLGEIADSETAKIAAQAAMTGHLVLTTLPTNDAPSAVTRLFNLGVEPYLVGASVTGVLAQRLVRKVCQACKEPYAPTITERRLLGKFGGSIETLYRAKGCARCSGLGYRGRIGIYELMATDDTLNERISQGASLNEIRALAQTQGMKSLRADGIDKVKAGITTLEEIFRVTA